MAKKHEETIVEKAEKEIVKTAKKVAHAVEEAEDKMEKIAKKVEKKIETAIVEAAHEAVGDTGKVVVEKKKKSASQESKEEKVEPAKLTAEEKKAKLAKLLEKAKKLEKTVSEVKDIDLKKKVKPEDDEEKKDTLVPMEDYLKSSIHLGTRVITPDMRPYVYRRRADGLAVFNTALLDDKMREGAAYLATFEPKDIIVVCKREAGWKAAQLFSQVTGIRAFTKKYPAGILTNTELEKFTEAELVFICDPWLDKNALAEANRVGIPVLSICDTNNFTAGIATIIPGNNKSAKSLGMIFYLLTKHYLTTHKLSTETPSIQEFVEGWDTLVPPK